MVATPDQTWIQIHPTVDCQWFRIINGNVKKGRNRPSLRDLRVGCWWNQKPSEIHSVDILFRPFNSHDSQNHSTCQFASIWQLARFTARYGQIYEEWLGPNAKIVASTKRVMVLKIKLTRQNCSKWPSPSRHKRHVARLNHGSVKKTWHCGMASLLPRVRAKWNSKLPLTFAYQVSKLDLDTCWYKIVHLQHLCQWIWQVYESSYSTELVLWQNLRWNSSNVTTTGEDSFTVWWLSIPPKSHRMCFFWWR